MSTEKLWKDLSWQEKREERFKRWLSPPNVKFVSPEVEKLYKSRVTRFIKAIKLEEPDRVPVMLPTGSYPAFYGGASFRIAMYNYDEMLRTTIKFMDDMGDMDTFTGPGLIPSGKIVEAIDSRVTLLPGHGLPDDAPLNQFVEGEYMLADEYDWMISDPTDYILRVYLPRTHRLFQSFKKMPSLRNLHGAALVSALSDPEVRRAFQTLLDLTDEQQKYQAAYTEIHNIALSRGYTSVFGDGPRPGAPFDYFGDLLRGTRGIALDMKRQPQKLHEALEHQTRLEIESIKNYPMTDCPVYIMPLHKGDDMFMSDKQFETFYWPYLRRIFMAMIEEGLVPMPFAEGKFNRRLKQIADTPKSGIIWYFDQTDMAEAKRILGGVCCIAGNVPTSVVMTNAPAQVKEYCRRLIEDCAPGGGYILAGGASVDRGNMPNLKAMMEAAKEFGVYK